MKGFGIPKLILENAKGIKYLTISRKIVAIHKVIIKIMYYNSLLMEEYFYEVSTINIKQNTKNCLRILIIYWCYILLEKTFLSPAAILSIGLGMFNLYFNIFCYFSTIFLEDYFRIEQLNVVMLLFFYINTIFETHDHLGPLEANLTPILQISIVMFSNLRITVQNALIIWICSYVVYIIGVHTSIEHKNTNNVPESAIYIYSASIEKYEYNKNESRLEFSLMILGGSISVFYLYLHFVNNFHRRYSFKKLGHDIQAKVRLKAAIKVQMHWFNVIMPKTIKEEYWEHNDDIKVDKWVYIKSFDNVSILFADIVGFTKLSSNKSASRVVALLNDLFNRFDELCILTNCEKLGTLGDCYYCVAGCPVSRPDHAISCIEMGLGMCRIIKKFNQDHHEQVEMRVGIHTGRVNAAILGKKRFRFDVYSNDVLIANTMESSGKPGRVHISESVYQFIRHAYVVEPGDDLEIKREHGHGIAGMVLKSTFIKTYFIDPQSSHFQLTDDRFHKKSNLKLITIPSRNVSSTADLKKDSDEESNTKYVQDTAFQNKIFEQMKFISDLRFDPLQKINLLTNPPLNRFSLTFREKEIEWHFNIAALNLIDLESLSWLEFGALIDGLACYLYSILLYIALFILFPSLSWRDTLVIVSNNILSIIILIINTCHSLYFKHYLMSSEGNWVYLLISHPIIRAVMCFYFLSSPLITIILILNDCTQIYIDIYFTVRYFILILFSLFIIPLFLSAHYFLKVTVCIMNVLIAFSVFNAEPCIRRNFRYTFSQYTCHGQMNITDVSYNRIVKYNFLFQIALTFVVLIVIIREIEINFRLLFYIMRENRISYEEASRAMRDAQELLYNIIPKYVFNQLKIQPGNEKEITSFNYATSIPKAAVIFACISNFFSKYYREDYKSGENALKLLHKIICFFDDIIKKEIYKDIEKIKTINDCYMVASGLNSKLIDVSYFKHGHLSSLMYYAFDIMNALEVFNENFIIGTEKFQIKIGYNFGPVTAGIIGASKPMYDIWGDTVNVSSRMYTTGTPGKIQVPDYVSFELGNEFLFKYRDKIFVKGKGEMATYICKGPLRVSDKVVVEKITNTIANRKSILNAKFIKKFYRPKVESFADKRPRKSLRKEIINRQLPKVQRKYSEIRNDRPRSILVKNVFVGFTYLE